MMVSSAGPASSSARSRLPASVAANVQLSSGQQGVGRQLACDRLAEHESGRQIAALDLDGRPVVEVDRAGVVAPR